MCPNPRTAVAKVRYEPHATSPHDWMQAPASRLVKGYMSSGVCLGGRCFRASVRGTKVGTSIGGTCLERGFGARVCLERRLGATIYVSQSGGQCAVCAPCHNPARLEEGPRTTFNQGLYLVGGMPWWPEACIDFRWFRAMHPGFATA